MRPQSTTAPWHKLYAPGVEPHLTAPQTSTLAMFLATVATEPDAAALLYFGRTLSRRELATLSAKIATVLRRSGVCAGDRVAICLQNTPVFAAGLLAVWGLGGTVVPMNPMLRPDELTPMLSDCGARILLAHPAMADVIGNTWPRLAEPPAVLWSDPSELAGDLPMPFGPRTPVPPEGRSLLAEAEGVDEPDELRPPAPSDIALLTYTSGTTGPSKGAMSTHANLAYQIVSGSQWYALDEHSSVLSVAPLFHITGLGLHAALALGGGFPLVLTYRFEAATVLDLIDRYEPTYAVGAITAFIALLDSRPDCGPILAKLTTVYSGGAPVPAEVVARFQQASGRYIHNIYGLTETTSACIGTPLGSTAPVDERSGALSVGVPMGGTTVTIVDDAGQPVPAGAEGEIVVSGPQVDAGCWHRPEETEKAFRVDGVHTGDVGVMDPDGWVYVVDRKKDLIVVSGYKVWPREVEDVLYRHPAVREAAVVGRPDAYRGETLHAYVSVRRGQRVTAGELRALCREHLSAYKVPAQYLFVDELPKTTTGKMMRRTLRDQAS
jgi:long-chain acyl-CoA synthetase